MGRRALLSLGVLTCGSLVAAQTASAPSALVTPAAAVAPVTSVAAVASPSPLDLPAAVREDALALLQQAAAALAPPGARIQVSAGVLDVRLRLTPCARIEPYLLAGLSSWGHTRVGLRCQSGQGGSRTAWRAFLPVQVQVLAPAWTSRSALPAGAVLATDQWELVDTDWAAAATPPLGARTQIAGRTLARPVAPGQALRESDLQARRWFSNGQPVRIVATGAGYSISAEGQALGHGIEGQPVRVRTEAGRILTGQAVGEGVVEVRL